MEFAFDIYRTTKGSEGTGIQVTFEVLTHQWDPDKRIDDPKNPGILIRMEDAYTRDSQGLANLTPADANWAKVNDLAERYGRYVVKNWQVFDYHTSAIPVPGGLFKNALAGTPDRDGPIQAPAGRPAGSRSRPGARARASSSGWPGTTCTCWRARGASA